MTWPSPQEELGSDESDDLKHNLKYEGQFGLGPVKKWRRSHTLDGDDIQIGMFFFIHHFFFTNDLQLEKMIAGIVKTGASKKASSSL
jgi:hypothetical protein